MAYAVVRGKLTRKPKPKKQSYDYSLVPETKFSTMENPPLAYPKDKGDYEGSCNRFACLKPGANWYNHFTRKYYCEECAIWLNEDTFNKRDALQLYGHDLCTKGEHI